MSTDRNGMLFPLLSILWDTAFVIIGALLCHGISTALPSEPLVPTELMAEAVFAVTSLAGPASVVGYLMPFDPLERVGAIKTNLTHISRDSKMLFTSKLTDSLRPNRTAESIFMGA